MQRLSSLIRHGLTRKRLLARATDNEEIGEAVQEWAYSLFADLGVADDYCVQYVGTGAIVFGGRNRIKLSREGFSLDAEYCDEKVKQAWIDLVTARLVKRWTAPTKGKT